MPYQATFKSMKSLIGANSLRGTKEITDALSKASLEDDKDGNVIRGGNLAHIPRADNVASIQLNHFLKADGKDIYWVGFAVCKRATKKRKRKTDHLMSVVLHASQGSNLSSKAVKQFILICW